MPDVSVIICAYTEERWDELVSAVEGVQGQSLPPKEILIVIDHNPRLWQRARERFPAARVLENRESRGLSGARNSGIQVASGGWIAFIDEDARPESNWLETLARAYDHPDVIGVGGAIEPVWPASRPEWFPPEFDWVVGCTYRGLPETTARVRNLIGCNMSFRREIFEIMGGFRSGIGRVGALPVGCEETEFCIRAQQRCPQWIFRFEPQARVHHRVHPSRTRLKYFTSRCFFEGRSKAIVTRWVGRAAGLASERAYTLRTLPAGFFGGLEDALRRGEPAGLKRAGAILAGLSLTALGYLSGKLLERGQPDYTDGTTDFTVRTSTTDDTDRTTDG